MSGGEHVFQPENSMVDLGAHENFQGAPSQTENYMSIWLNAFGNGSVGSPYPTINHALNNFFENSGDTIVVKDGTYHEALNIHQLYTYDYLTIRSENGAQNTIINHSQCQIKEIARKVLNVSLY